ncbi:MAG: response regulator [Thermanaerothrix sp.]|jgi:DNA-binding NarL/FixJ family response regulator|uniref:Response regulator transcription factor n=1 Tax=Thermanaerothrix solaris TaxID=3058434 RepID=A0ABU3NIL6_9CHLR|nr:response regulator transcription factor [Thermanaerothrix sp. 4228-RoL]MDT8896692.1 response regulator transcription factor [Thermanaerothrix sp. 4228-RoL]
MSTRAVRVVVVDDHALFRRGLIELLRDMPELKVVGEAGNGQEALEVIRHAMPDVVLLDINMPHMDGLRTLEVIRKFPSSPKVLMLTVSQHEEDLMQAIRSGADGYLLKNVEPEELRKAILRVYQGEGALSPEVTAPVLRAIAYQSEIANRQILSDRELEVLECLADGQTTGQIAAKLYISDNTVKTHVRHILEKLEASNRTEAVSKAIALGLIRRREG